MFEQSNFESNMKFSIRPTHYVNKYKLIAESLDEAVLYLFYTVAGYLHNE